MTKKPKDIVQFKIECLIRSWTYVATISKKTGRLKHIKAGCRNWKTFSAAYTHYAVYGNGVWSDTAIGEDNRYSYACRAEAVAILRKLENDVIVYLIKIRNQKQRAARKAKRK